jgi:2-hydroxychromene-2-carboxylate isomerase
MPRPTLEFWFDFASTYSYPAMMRIRSSADAADVAVHYRPFLLGPIFKQQGWDNSPFNLYAAKGRNMWRDLERLCGDLGLRFRPPEPFPQQSLSAARIALVGLGQPWGEDFCRAVFHAEFADGRRIDQPTTMMDILTRLGVDPAAVMAVAQSAEVKDALRTATAQAQARGIFGAPSFVTPDGELFWGNERLERALVWAVRGN